MNQNLSRNEDVIENASYITKVQEHVFKNFTCFTQVLFYPQYADCSCLM